MLIRGDGPIPTRLMIVGDFPSLDDLHHGQPFSSSAGTELNKMLHEAGFLRSEVYVTYTHKSRPTSGKLNALLAEKKKDITAAHVRFQGRSVLPEIRDSVWALWKEIDAVQPNLIITVGDLALWALTEKISSMKWRGSQLYHRTYKVIPTLNPSVVFKMWELRALILNDLRRAKRHFIYPGLYINKPAWKFQVSPTLSSVRAVFEALQLRLTTEEVWLDFDIETRYGHIDCIAFSWSKTEGICIPLISARSKEGYWSIEEEAYVVYQLYKLLTHLRVRVRWQNGLYDAQYTHRHWHFIPRGCQDTMIAQHSIFAALPKGLAVLGSLYADWYVYWKDEGKLALGCSEQERWVYNLQDCVYTREVGEVLTNTIQVLGLSSVDAQQQELFYPVLTAMLKGVRVIPEQKEKMAMEIQEEMSKREAFLYNILGHDINIASSKQMQTLFYEDLAQKPILKRTMVNGSVKLSPTCDDEALTQIGQREPLLKPLCNAIADIRTLNKFFKDFVMMQLDEDDRMRCSFNIAGDAAGKSAPYSYRLSSSKNAFDSGGNLQTIPSEKSKSSGKAAARGSMEFKLPNIRSMYGPDPGFTFFDMDLDRADLQVVVRESGEVDWIAAMDLGVDMHLLNVYTLDGKEPPPLDELIETHPKYLEHRAPRKHKREFSKVFCHACVTAGHEVLTKTGWWPIEHLMSKTEIAVWNKDTQAIHFEIPSELHCDTALAGETLFSFEGQAFSQEVTADHRMPYSTTDAQTFSIAQAQALPATAKLPTAGYYSGTRQVDEAAIRLLAAFQADGTYDYKYKICWHLKKQRKIDRLLCLLKEMNLTPSIQKGWNGAIKIFVYWRPVAWMKVPGAWLLELDGQALDWWLDELKYWDGYVGTTGATHISSSNPEAAEWINTIALLRGKGSRCYIHTKAEGNRKANWHISLNKRTLAGMESMQVTEIFLTKDTPVYCPTTTTGFFMVRRNGKISVTGNTNYLGRPKTVAAHTGRSIAEITRAQEEWFYRHPGIKQWHERVIAQINKYRFVENRFGYRWYIFDRINELMYPEAVAWIPQSTVGILINKIWCAFYREVPEVQVLLQVHDSLAGQFPTHRRNFLIPKMEQASRIVIPYDVPLIIPTGIKTSTISWGDCE